MDSNSSSRSSTFRRPSMSTYLGSNASPTERSVSNLRHVGEGVLDDSDSSSARSDEDEEGDETTAMKPGDSEIGLHQVHSPLLTSLRMRTAPSPLSRVAGHHVWTEDELDGGNDDNASSPSPQSSDTDSNAHSSSKPRRFSRASRRSSGRIKSRSRSSTVASLSTAPRPLIRRDSLTSIRTVIAGEPSPNNGYQLENSSSYQRSIGGHGRQRSAISEIMLNGAKVVDQEERNGSQDDNRLSERRIEAIVVEDMRFKETTLCALREALEVFSEEV